MTKKRLAQRFAVNGKREEKKSAASQHLILFLVLSLSCVQTTITAEILKYIKKNNIKVVR
jgi:hypothetical protein